MRGLTSGGSAQPSMSISQLLFLVLVAETTGRPCRISSATASPGLHLNHSGIFLLVHQERRK
jgi:hypothetical protein